MSEFLDRQFGLSKRGTDVRTEVFAGVTTFMTMAYIIFVNPAILSETGMPFGPLMVSTCLAAAFATLVMAFLANYPIALASGMGLNAFFTYTVVLTMGVSWQVALAAIFVEGIIFCVLSVTKVREAIVSSIPMSLKHGIAAGIGLFIALIGFQGGGITVHSPATLVSAAAIRNNIPAILTILGIVLIGVFEHFRVRGAIMWVIIIITIIAIPLGEAKLPDTIVSLPPSIAPIFMQMDFSGISSGIFTSESVSFWLVVLTFFFVDFFDTIGTIVGTAGRANLLDEKGELPKAKEALLSDAVGTCAGAVLGVSTVTSYVESASGISAGGRTGLTSVVTAVLFLLALFFSPVVSIVPACATAPALVFVGIYMLTDIRKINFEDWSDSVPAVIAVFAMPFCYSISSGIEFGVFSYVGMKALTGKIGSISITIWILTILFVLKEMFI